MKFFDSLSLFHYSRFPNSQKCYIAPAEPQDSWAAHHPPAEQSSSSELEKSWRHLFRVTAAALCLLSSDHSPLLFCC